MHSRALCVLCAVVCLVSDVSGKPYLVMDGYVGTPDDRVAMYFAEVTPSPTFNYSVPLLPHYMNDTGYFGGCVVGDSIWLTNASVYSPEATIHVYNIKTKKETSKSKPFQIGAMIQDTRCDSTWKELIFTTTQGKSVLVWSVTLEGEVKLRLNKTFPGFLGEYDADAPAYDSNTHSILFHFEATYGGGYHKHLLWANLESGKTILKDLQGAIFAPQIYNGTDIYFLNTTMTSEEIATLKRKESVQLPSVPVFLSRWDLTEASATPVGGTTGMPIKALDEFYDTAAFSPMNTFDTWGADNSGVGALLRWDLKTGKGTSVELPPVWFELLLPWSYARWVDMDI